MKKTVMTLFVVSFISLAMAQTGWAGPTYYIFQVGISETNLVNSMVIKYDVPSWDGHDRINIHVNPAQYAAGFANLSQGVIDAAFDTARDDMVELKGHDKKRARAQDAVLREQINILRVAAGLSPHSPGQWKQLFRDKIK